MAPVTRIPAMTPKETGGSPEFPDYPSERMPRSQTPVVSPPLAWTRTGLLPSGHWIPSAFNPVARIYRLTTTIHFSEFNSAACVLASPLLRPPPLGGRTLVRLPARWLAFGRVGLIGSHRRTHWVIMTSFKGSHPFLSSLAFLGTTGDLLGINVIIYLVGMACRCKGCSKGLSRPKPTLRLKSNQ